MSSNSKLTSMNEVSVTPSKTIAFIQTILLVFYLQSVSHLAPYFNSYRHCFSLDLHWIMWTLADTCYRPPMTSTTLQIYPKWLLSSKVMSVAQKFYCAQENNLLLFCTGSEMCTTCAQTTQVFSLDFKHSAKHPISPAWLYKAESHRTSWPRPPG